MLPRPEIILALREILGHLWGKKRKVNEKGTLKAGRHSEL
jgi:hypothetical protein